MIDDDIHKMMDRAHYAEIREQRLRVEVDRLKAENERLRRDAERYRWICRFPEDADYAVTHALNGCSRPGSVDGSSFRDLLCAAIDKWKEKYA